MGQDGDYILGTGDDERQRLGFQHFAWSAEAHALWKRVGLREGHEVADLGCGPGFTTLDLAQWVGPSGRVVACDKSARFIDWVTDAARQRGWTQIEPRLGGVEELDLPRESLDGAYARWLLCWVEKPQEVLARVARALRPGGFVALQEYLDWGAMRMIPTSAIFDEAVEACMRGWERSGVTIDIVRELPELAEACGLRVDRIEPLSAAAPSGSPKWRWIGEFFASHLPRIVQLDLLDPDAPRAFRDEWANRTVDGRSYCLTPTMADVVLIRP